MDCGCGKIDLRERPGLDNRNAMAMATYGVGGGQRPRTIGNYIPSRAMQVIYPTRNAVADCIALHTWRSVNGGDESPPGMA